MILPLGPGEPGPPGENSLAVQQTLGVADNPPEDGQAEHDHQDGSGDEQLENVTDPTEESSEQRGERGDHFSHDLYLLG